MPGFRLTKAAKADMRGIGRYTRKRWGRDQAHRYLGDLDDCYHRLAEKPDLGVCAVEPIRPDFGGTATPL
jgi:toxin ParE1/3/4